ncbi:MAG: glycosyltransferase family protein [Ginsengibacter sp.]
MKILYAIQGTGNGHISRARDIIPELQKKGNVDILISGTESDVSLGFPIKYRLKGLSFVFGKKGGIDLMSTYKKAKLKRFFKEAKDLPVKNYDIVINDFEPVSAWSCVFNHKQCISLSHQAAVLNKMAPQPDKKDMVGKAILKKYAPVTDTYGFHFEAYDKNIFTPVIRDEIRNANNLQLPHHTVYLPAYDDKRIIKVLKEIKEVQWEVFSKHTKKTYKEKNIAIRPVDNQAFIKSMVTCTGVLCGAGFETPAEALFLKKKLMVIPMKGQYEQQCNAAALKKMGVPVLKKLKISNIENIAAWVKDIGVIQVDYPNITDKIIDEVFIMHLNNSNSQPLVSGNNSFTENKFRKIHLGNILHQIKS